MTKGVKHKDRLALGATNQGPLAGITGNSVVRAALQKTSGPKERAGELLLLSSIDEVFERFDIDSGSTLAFHHHFRNGDRVLQAVVDCAAKHGVDDLTIAASSIFPVHAGLVPHIESGVITNIVTDYMTGPVADAVTAGLLSGTVVFQSHGGRARAISSGELPIDFAFVGASCADRSGAATGRQGQLACGPLGYSMVDAAHARATIILAHEISVEAIGKVDIPASQVDAVVPYPYPGLPDGISFGSTVPLRSPEADLIGRRTVDVIRAAGLFRDGFSFQTGAGGYPLATVPHIGRLLEEEDLVGEFVSGGITGAHVEIARQRHVKYIKDVQCFDQAAVASSTTDVFHLPMSAAEYASPIYPNPIVDNLSVMVLGASEVDANFNINVITGGNGRIIGGPGGHPDAASGAKLTIVTTRLAGGGYAKLVEEVGCIATPGDDVDVVITDVGIAVNPKKPQLVEDLENSGTRTTPIAELIDQAKGQASRTRKQNAGEVCSLVEDRNGHLLDVILGD